MKNATPTAVIWVGDAEGEGFGFLTEGLRRSGVALEIAENSDQLRAAVERSLRAVVVVQDDQTRLGLDATLVALERICRPVTVVAILDEPTFGRCYDLMARGVKYCYGLSEGAGRVASAIQHIAARAA